MERGGPWGPCCDSRAQKVNMSRFSHSGINFPQMKPEKAVQATLGGPQPGPGIPPSPPAIWHLQVVDPERPQSSCCKGMGVCWAPRWMVKSSKGVAARVLCVVQMGSQVRPAFQWTQREEKGLVGRLAQRCRALPAQ